MTMDKKEIINVTGTNYLVYVLWGQSPEWPDYAIYGFETEKEQQAFLVGIDEGEGWMGYMAGTGQSTDKDSLQKFEEEVRREHPDLFEETT